MFHDDKPLHQQPLTVGPEANRIAVYPELTLKGNYSREGKLYKLTISTEGGVVLGDMDFAFLNDAVDQSHKKLPPHVLIIDMHSTRLYPNIGSAMHEFAFKFSLDQGGQGRVILEAVRDTHYFHYKNEFRLAHANRRKAINYYLDLARALIKAGQKRIAENLSSINLSLSSVSIKRNIAKYGLNNIPDPEPDETSHLQHIALGEKIMEEAKKESLAIKILLALTNNYFGYGFRENEPDLEKDSLIFLSSEEPSPFMKENPSLFCEYTKRLVNTLVNSLIDLIPIDTEEKNKKLALLVCGATIIAMAYQDKTYGEQKLYESKRLYPDKTLQELSQLLPEGSLVNESSFMTIGENALIHKTLPYPGIHPQFFPDLSAIPLLMELFANAKSEMKKTPQMK